MYWLLLLYDIIYSRAEFEEEEENLIANEVYAVEPTAGKEPQADAATIVYFPPRLLEAMIVNDDKDTLIGDTTKKKD